MRVDRKERGASRISAPSWIRALATCAIVTFLTLAIAEGTARILTGVRPNGMKYVRILNVELGLVPFRPDEAHVRKVIELLRHDPLLTRDPDLGFNVVRNRAYNGDYTNAQGFRANPERLYSFDPPTGKIRIQTVGDSFVYALEVKNGETWQDYLEQTRDDIELLNLGVPAFGTDQAYLRWKRDGSQFKSQIVILGIWPDNIFRNLTILSFYRDQVGLGLTKPRLVIDAAGTTKFVNAPVMSDDELVTTFTHPEGSQLLHYDYWYNHDKTKDTLYRRVRILQIIESVWWRYQLKKIHSKIYSGEIPDGIDVTVAIAKLFVKEVRAAGSIPIVLIIPDQALMFMEAAENQFPLVRQLRNAGIDVIDMGPTFGKEATEKGAADYYTRRPEAPTGMGHYSPFGNHVFANYLEKELRPFIEKAKALSKNPQAN